MNTIRIYLAESGRIADLKKDFPLYQGQFQNKLLNIYVPTSILAPNFTSQTQDGNVTEFVAGTGVKIGMLHTMLNGTIKKSKNYYMRYLKTLTYQNVEYALYERKLPKEFTLYSGQGANAPTLAINVVNVQTDLETPKVLSVITSQQVKLDVMPSSLLDQDEAVEPSELEVVNASLNEVFEQLERKQDKVDSQLEAESKTVVYAINENRSNININATKIRSNETQISANRDEINKIKQEYAMAEEYITTYTFDKEPDDDLLNRLVVSTVGRQPKNGDVILFVYDIPNETNKNYKYIYSKSGWSRYEIPPVEMARNGSLGLIEGTYSVGLDNDTLVDISGGKIVAIWVKNGNGYRNIVEYLNSLNEDILDIINGNTVVGEAMKALEDGFGNNIANTYLRKSDGVTRQYVKDYAMPRIFNDVDFISSTGFQDDVPTTPASGVQFSTLTNAVGDFQLLQVSKTNTADFELSAKNGYSNNIYISANAECKVTFRLTTEYKKVGEDWKTLNVELVSHNFTVADDIERIMFSGSFISLGEDVVTIKEGDTLRQTLDVITQTSAIVGFEVYSNEVYPSSFSLTSQYYIPASVENTYGKIIALGIDGIIEANKVVFTVQDAESFEEYKANQREFLVNGNLPIVGELDDTFPVYITFGNTTYGVFSYMKGSKTPITIGDLKSNMTYSAEIGYSFTSKMVFLETSDYRGFAISPATVTAEQLANIIKDTQTVVVSLDANGTKLNLNLSAEIVNKLAKTLVTPMTKPAKTELVGVDSQNMQTMIELGDGLTLENGVLKVSATGGVSEEYVNNAINSAITSVLNTEV